MYLVRRSALSSPFVISPAPTEEAFSSENWIVSLVLLGLDEYLFDR